MKNLITIFALAFAMQACAQNSKSVNQTKDLTDEQAYILLQKGTESRFSSALNGEKRRGSYVSAATGDTLFLSGDKFNSGTGWPSFDSATDKVALGPREQGGYEVIEKSTGYHLGHLFQGEMFTSKDKRYCINGDALLFVPAAPEVLYDGFCGWAAVKGYKYKASPDIYVISKGDTVRFYNESTKNKWIDYNKPRKVADKNWIKIKKDDN